MAATIPNNNRAVAAVEPLAPVATHAATANEPTVVVRGARHRFGQHLALAGVDVEIRRGEIYGLLGPNGAGKTTLMKAICGRIKLDEGQVRLDGKDPRKDRATRCKIGFVPQDIALYANLTVRENLRAFARLAGVRRRDVRNVVAQGLERMGLSERADQLCRTLSGGFQRRVNICASILHKPSLLVLDEPTVGIDIDAREAIHRLLLDLRSQGTSILLTTHDLDQAQALSDRVGILIAGRFVAEGRPVDVLQQLFEGRMELVVELASLPDASASAALQALGLGPSPTNQTRAELSWTGYFRPDELDLKSVEQRLASAGVAVKEMRLRQPGLTSLVVTLLLAEAQR